MTVCSHLLQIQSGDSMTKHFAAFCCFIFIAACAANPVQVVTPVSDAVIGQNQVTDVAVTVGETAQEAMVAFDEKAADKRTDAGLDPFEANSTSGERPDRDEYATLPFATMLPLVVEDVAREWGLTSGRNVRLDIAIDTIKTANAGIAAIGFGSSDQLAGTVEVSDANTREPLGEFYVDVINTHGGLLGLALRGGSIREKLAEEFALHVSRQLTGSEDRPE